VLDSAKSSFSKTNNAISPILAKATAQPKKEAAGLTPADEKPSRSAEGREDGKVTSEKTPGPAIILVILSHMYTRLFRIYGHYYRHHLPQIRISGDELLLNTSFKWFVLNGLVTNQCRTRCKNALARPSEGNGLCSHRPSLESLPVCSLAYEEWAPLQEIVNIIFRRQETWMRGQPESTGQG
jgi:hypothetical protein